MKRLLLVILLGYSGISFAQIEPKIDALGTVFGMPAIKAEYIVNENFGIELSFNSRFGKPNLNPLFSEAGKQSGGGFKIESRFYFSSYDVADSYYGSIYLRNQSLTYEFFDDYDESSSIYDNKFTAIGLLIGYKYVLDSGITIDMGIGLGRMLSHTLKDREGDDEFNFEEDEGWILNFDYFGTFGIGYRFDFKND